jgi:hypothetical protein
MQNLKFKFKIKNFFLIFFICALFYAFYATNEAYAAQLYFDPQEKVIGTQGEFLTAVNVKAQNPVNAFSVAIKIPPELAFLDASDGNSIINFWVDKPRWDEKTRILSFSGITPGGFTGEATLLVIKLKAESEGQALLSFNKEQTKIYLHSPDGIEDELRLSMLNLPIVQGKMNIPVQLPDSNPPESFTPEVVRDFSVFGGEWFLIFSTQDKGSGLLHYEIAESKRIKSWGDAENMLPPKSARWVLAESPYLLEDQKLRSYIFIKAVDKEGNKRISVLPPQKPLAWYENYLFYVIILSIVIVYIVWRSLRRKKIFR